METMFNISTPPENLDSDSARRVFESFLTIYQPTLERVEDYLEEIIDTKAPVYGAAYEPWHDALKNLLRGAYLMSRKIPLPNKEDFLEALKMFSFESTILFLRDVCLSCHIKLMRDWEENFRSHINMLLFAFAKLQQTAQAQTPAR